MARGESFFDDLARGLADGSVTRGKALRLMGAAVVGGTLGSFGISGVAVADDECKPNNKKCRKDKQCCSGKCDGGKCAPPPPPGCTPGTTCGPAGSLCFANASGVGATCVCEGGACVTSCDMCSGSEVCVLAAGTCGIVFQFSCETPCPGT
jgi:hypothetical protein